MSVGQMFSQVFDPWIEFVHAAAVPAPASLPVVPMHNNDLLRRIISVDVENKALKAKLAAVEKELCAFATKRKRIRKSLASESSLTAEGEEDPDSTVSLAHTKRRVAEFHNAVHTQCVKLSEDTDTMIPTWLSMSGIGREWVEKSAEGANVQHEWEAKWNEDNAIDRNEFVAACDVAGFADDKRTKFVEMLPSLKQWLPTKWQTGDARRKIDHTLAALLKIVPTTHRGVQCDFEAVLKWIYEMSDCN
jgi:hypothetical protein